MSRSSSRRSSRNSSSRRGSKNAVLNASNSTSRPILPAAHERDELQGGTEGGSEGGVGVKNLLQWAAGVVQRFRHPWLDPAPLSFKEFLEKAKEDFEEKWKTPTK
ncbi:hypothetical protein C7M84_022398, partial [Penaeus vannamei]